MSEYEVDNDDVSVNSTDSIGSFDYLDDPVEDEDLAKEARLQITG
jgi:hypothetical protein